jgi:hypothetical protein
MSDRNASIVNPGHEPLSYKAKIPRFQFYAQKKGSAQIVKSRAEPRRRTISAFALHNHTLTHPPPKSQNPKNVIN